MNDPSGQQVSGQNASGQQAQSRPVSRGVLSVFAADEQTDVVIDAARWRSLAEHIIREEGVMDPGVDVEVSLLFVDELTIANLNQQFMGKKGPTDVLSFPIDDPRDEADPGTPIGGSPFAIQIDSDDERADFADDDDRDAPALLGDVLICPTIAARNAPDHSGPNHDGSLDDELALLVVHGLLHLLGMDHVIDAEAEAMEAREQELLTRFHRIASTSGPGVSDTASEFFDETIHSSDSSGPGGCDS
jgi:probable rRNA maturation factor